MAERRTIGQILTSIGRISDDDVAEALEYQRDNGGYFGEALMACGFVSRDELEWGLASQFDLPYVFPDADSIDMEAASAKGESPKVTEAARSNKPAAKLAEQPARPAATAGPSPART